MAYTAGIRTHYRNCNLCEAMCGLEIQVQGNDILQIRGDKQDPFSRGYICPKAVALRDIYYDSDRLKHPVRRTQNGWKRITWNEALDEVAANLNRIQKTCGNDAVGVYLGNPAFHSYSTVLFSLPFFESLNTRNRFSSVSIDTLPMQLVAYLMFGHQLMMPVPDIDRTDFFLILGANPVVSNGSLMTAPGVANRLKAIRQRGGKIVVIDPRRTETSALAHQHYFIRPGTDVLLMLALLHAVFKNNGAYPGRLASFSDGMEAVQSVVTDFPPEKVEKIIGINAENIYELAREFASAKSAVCYGRVGISTQEFGAVTHWLMLALNIVAGKMDRPGGFMFTKPAVDAAIIAAKIGQQGHFGRRFSRVRRLPEFADELPAAAMAEEMLTEGQGQIKAMITIAGNPVLSTPNGRQLEQGLANLEYMAAIDFYINETTRYANVILPPTAAFENEHYDLVFHGLAVRNTAKYSLPLFEPPKDAKHEWEILLELQSRLGIKDLKHAVFTWLLKPTLKRMQPQGLLDVLVRFGPYGAKFNPFGKGLTLNKLKKAVHGIDLGPLESCLPERLFTASKRIQLAPEILVNDLERVKNKFFNGAQRSENNFDMLLIGRRQLRSNNSWMHNSLRLVKGKKHCTALMHPSDAVKRGLSSGDTIRVCSRVWTIEIKLEISEEIMPGVISIPHGWGHHRPGVKLEVAQNHAGVSINDITDHTYIDTLCGSVAVNGVPVRVEQLSVD